jgi:hypothetical protein
MPAFEAGLVRGNNVQEEGRVWGNNTMEAPVGFVSPTAPDYIKRVNSIAMSILAETATYLEP